MIGRSKLGEVDHCNFFPVAWRKIGLPRHVEANSFSTLKDFEIEEDTYLQTHRAACSFPTLHILDSHTPVASTLHVIVVTSSCLPKSLKLMQSF